MGIQNYYIKGQAAGSGGGWVRPSDWLPMPTFSPGDEKIAGLYAIYENEYNYVVIVAPSGVGASTIDWGDGTSMAGNGTYATKIYDYATLSGSVYVDEYGRNYKQVIVLVTIFTGTNHTIRWDRDGVAGINVGKTSTVLDLKAQTTTVLTFDWLFNRFAPYCQRVDLQMSGYTSIYSITNFSRAMNIEVLEYNKTLTGNNALVYANNNVIREVEDSTINFSNMAGFFSSSEVQTVGNLNLPNTTSVGSLLTSSSVRQCGDITAPLATNAFRFFRDATSLTKVGTITLSPSLTTIGESFFQTQVREVVFASSLASVTATASAFGGANNLIRLVLPDLTVGFTIAGSSMSATALNEMFTSLGTAAGSQTITVTNNPGAATCDTTIATGKGYTVVI